MDSVIDFLLNNYIWFLVISLILVFALIGYLVDLSTPKITKEQNEKTDKKLQEKESV